MCHGLSRTLSRNRSRIGRKQPAHSSATFIVSCIFKPGILRLAIQNWKKLFLCYVINFFDTKTKFWLQLSHCFNSSLSLDFLRPDLQARNFSAPYSQTKLLKSIWWWWVFNCYVEQTILQLQFSHYAIHKVYFILVLGFNFTSSTFDTNYDGTDMTVMA